MVTAPGPARAAARKLKRRSRADDDPAAHPPQAPEQQHVGPEAAPRVREVVRMNEHAREPPQDAREQSPPARAPAAGRRSCSTGTPSAAARRTARRAADDAHELDVVVLGERGDEADRGPHRAAHAVGVQQQHAHVAAVADAGTRGGRARVRAAAPARCTASAGRPSSRRARLGRSGASAVGQRRGVARAGRRRADREVVLSACSTARPRARPPPRRTRTRRVRRPRPSGSGCRRGGCRAAAAARRPAAAGPRPRSRSPGGTSSPRSRRAAKRPAAGLGRPADLLRVAAAARDEIGTLPGGVRRERALDDRRRRPRRATRVTSAWRTGDPEPATRPIATSLAYRG